MPIADTLQGKIGLTIYAVFLALANIIVILTYAVNQRLRTLANRFVIGLAISDLLVSLFFVPFKAWLPAHESIGAMTAFFLLASLFNICGCTYDRYIAIKNPLHYPAIMTKARFFQVMVVVWLAPLVIAIIPQVWVQNAEALKLSKFDLYTYERYFVAFMIVLVLVICFVLIAIYVYIFVVAKRHYEAMKKSEPPTLHDASDDRKARKRRSQSVKNFFVAIKSTMLFATIGAGFVLCWLPLIILNITFAFDRIHLLPPEFIDIAEILMYFNSFLNPVAYAFFQKEFRRSILRLCVKSRIVSTSETITQHRTDYETNHSYQRRTQTLATFAQEKVRFSS